MNEVDLHNKHLKFHLYIDYIITPNLSRIKEISKRINFATISTEQQIFNNKGNAYYKSSLDEIGEYISNLTLDYTIKPRELGIVYGTVNIKTDDDGNEKATFKTGQFNNYARFIADLIADKVIYSSELESFIFVRTNKYEVLDETNFALNYPVDNKHRIDDFLEVMLELYRDHFTEISHNYEIYPYTFAGKDWVYDCKNLEMKKYKPKSNELYFDYYPVEASSIDTDTPNNFFRMVSDNEKSRHNIRLVHAYTMYRKINLIPAEKWFLIKDFGRSGKGLFMQTFEGMLQTKKVNFDSLTGGGFEATNEWLNFYGADLAHANETGEITKQYMRILRKIATSETVAGRRIGRDTFTFKNRAVLVLDTNEDVDTGEITANRTRTVKISFKDRPVNETDDERHAIFKPYWDFLQSNGRQSLASSVSFMIASLNFLNEVGGNFYFNDVTLKNYYSEDDLSETQVILLKTLSRQDFVLSNDEMLQQAIEKDYGNLRYKKAKEDFKKIGIDINKQKWIEGINTKIHKVGNQELFDYALQLLSEG